MEKDNNIFKTVAKVVFYAGALTWVGLGIGKRITRKAWNITLAEQEFEIFHNESTLKDIEHRINILRKI